MNANVRFLLSRNYNVEARFSMTFRWYSRRFCDPAMLLGDWQDANPMAAGQNSGRILAGVTTWIL